MLSKGDELIAFFGDVRARVVVTSVKKRWAYARVGDGTSKDILLNVDTLRHDRESRYGRVFRSEADYRDWKDLNERRREARRALLGVKTEAMDRGQLSRLLEAIREFV